MGQILMKLDGSVKTEVRLIVYEFHKNWFSDDVIMLLFFLFYFFAFLLFLPRERILWQRAI